MPGKDKPKMPAKLTEEAAEAPVSSPAPPSISPKKNTGRARRMNRGNLGTLNVGDYLDHYGHEHFVKPQGAITRYCLRECVFDSSHSNNDASIVQSPNPPYLTYQCFHDSCKGRTWKDARAVISGDDKLAPFCEGYDPNWVPAGRQKLEDSDLVSQIIETYKPQLSPALLALSSDVVPPPGEVDPEDFFEDTGKKPTFSATAMAYYVMAFFGHLCFTDGVFWCYNKNKGIWQEITRADLISVVVHTMQMRLKASWPGNAIDILQGLVNRTADDWPKRSDLICCKTGMINILAENLKKDALLPHDNQYGAKVQIPCEFNTKNYAKIKRWLQFLDEIFPKKKEKVKIDVLQQFFGYCLLTDCRFAKSLWLVGGGNNGKSVVIDVLTGMLGEDNVSSISMHEVGERFRTYAMENKYANLSGETTRDAMGTDTYKKLVSGDLVSAERKYGEVYQFRNFSKQIFSFNDPPVILDRSHGLARRIIVIEFLRRFLPKEEEHNLAKRLIKEEIDGIFIWALDGLLKLIRNDGFEGLEEVDKAKERLLLAMHPFLQFINECCDVVDGEEVSTQEIWKAYQEWCNEGKYKGMTRNHFYRDITTKFPSVEKTRDKVGSKRIFRGIGLKVIPEV